MPALAPRFWVVPIVLGLQPLMSPAQPVYRCGNSYSQIPCAGGQAIAVEDSRTAAQKAQTDAATAQAARQADRMERERLAAERVSAAPSGSLRKASNTSPTNAKERGAGKKDQAASGSGKGKAKGKGKEPEYFTASSRPDDKKNKTTAISGD